MRTAVHALTEKLAALSARGDEGASAVEYALLASLVAGVIAIVVFGFGTLVLDLNHDNCTGIAASADPGYDCGPEQPLNR